MGDASEKLKRALRGEEAENSPSESEQEQQPTTADPGKSAGGAEEAPNPTAAAEEVD
jgi:hypothetical protein